MGSVASRVMATDCLASRGACARLALCGAKIQIQNKTSANRSIEGPSVCQSVCPSIYSSTPAQKKKNHSRTHSSPEPEPRAPGTHGSARPLISRSRVDALASRPTRGPHRRARTRPWPRRRSFAPRLGPPRVSFRGQSPDRRPRPVGGPSRSLASAPSAPAGAEASPSARRRSFAAASPSGSPRRAPSPATRSRSARTTRRVSRPRHFRRKYPTRRTPPSRPPR